MKQIRDYKGFKLAPLNNPNGHWVQILDAQNQALDTTICKSDMELAFIEAQKMVDKWETRKQIKYANC